ncbi:MAG: hypothetical protein LBO66_09515 [Deltaproteobacteria bacterium]|jgi:hypothetical protein|nr:hypothetical protein [Deltaproteobacteria bacterium]
MRLKIILALCLTLFVSFGAKAFACDCGILQGILNAVGDKIIAGIAVPLDSTIRAAASFESANFHKDLVALREAVLLSKDSLNASIATLDRDIAEREIERTFNEGSIPVTICGDNILGAGLQLGQKTLEVAAADILGAALARGERFERPLDYLEELNDPSWPGPERVARLWGVTEGRATLSLEELGGAARLIEGFANPAPLPTLPPESLSLPAGKAYAVGKKAFDAKMAFYQGVLAQRVASLAPTVEGMESWVTGKWADMGGEGAPPGLVEGRLSQDALTWFLTNVRLSSANWHEEILPTLPEAGLLRELASMKAVELELARQRNAHLENIATLLALQGLENLNGGPRAALMAQYSRVQSE